MPGAARLPDNVRAPCRGGERQHAVLKHAQQRAHVGHVVLRHPLLDRGVALRSTELELVRATAPCTSACCTVQTVSGMFVLSMPSTRGARTSKRHADTMTGNGWTE